MLSFSVFGRIIDAQNNPKDDLEVIAFDEDPFWTHDTLGRTVTDFDGKFHINFDQNDFGRFEGKPEVFLVIKDAGNEILKTRVKKTGNTIKYNIKLHNHNYNNSDIDIYKNTIQKSINSFQGIGNFIDLENPFDDKLTTIFNSMFALFNGTLHLYFESNGIDTLGYDGAQVEKNPWRKKHNDVVIWPRDE